MKVLCIDNSANGRAWLAEGSVYEVAETVSDMDGDFFRLQETGPMHWWANRFRPFDEREHFLSANHKQGADA
jgi:hypothetical protein